MNQRTVATAAKPAQAEAPKRSEVRAADPLQGAEVLAPQPTDALEGPVLREALGAPTGRPGVAFAAATRGAGAEVPYRGEMEQQFGADFGGVRAHTGQAASMAELGALAATRGEQVAFRDTTPDRHTVAHELTHVVQGRAGTVSGSPDTVGAAGSRAEREADQAADAVTSGRSPSVEAGPGAAIQRRPALADPTIDIPNELGAKGFKKSTYERFATRGDNLKAVDRWMAAIDGADTLGDLDYAVEQALDAVDNWLTVHPADKRKGSVKSRAPSIEAARGKLVALKGVVSGKLGAQPAGPGGSTPTPTPSSTGKVKVGQSQLDEGDAKVDKGDGVGAASKGDVASGVTDAYGSGAGVLSAGADIDSGNEFSDLKAEGGGSVGNSSDMAEGSGMMAGGVVGGINAINKFKDPKASKGDKAEAVFEGIAATGTTASGSAKLASGIMNQNKADSGGDAAKVSDGFASGVEVIGVGLQVADFGKGMSELKGGGWGQMGTMEKVDFVKARADNVIGVTKGVAGVVNGITKAATGAANVGASGVVAGAGVATGGLDFAHGAYKLASGGLNKTKLTKAQQGADEAILRVSDQIREIDEVLSETRIALAAAESAGKTKVVTDTKVALGSHEGVKQGLLDHLAELKASKAELQPALDAMRKVQNKRMKDGAMKMATGSLDVVSGALMLSGVGAPIAIALGALSGIIKLGSAGVSFARSSKASTLTKIALRLTDAGKAKGKPDSPDDVGFRTMEKRVNSAYYNNYLKAMHEKTPPAGLDSDQWGHIRDFVHEDKLGRVPLKQTQNVKKSEANSMGEGALRNDWGVIKADSDGKELDHEAPSKSRRIGLVFTASAHKSAQAMDASNAELAQAVVDIAMGSFDHTQKTFVPTAVNPAGGETAEIKATTARALLDNVGITDSVWAALWKKSGGHFVGDAKPDGSGNQTEALAPKQAAMVAEVKKKIDKL